MITTSCCLKVQNGLIGLVDSREEIRAFNGRNIEAERTGYGVNLIVGNLIIPIPNKLIDYLFENPVIAVYQLKRYAYVAEPDFVINLDKMTLMSLKGICHIPPYAYMGHSAAVVSH